MDTKYNTYLEDFLSCNLDFYDKYSSSVTSMTISNSHESYFGKDYYRIYISMHFKENLSTERRRSKDVINFLKARSNYLAYYAMKYEGYEIYADAQKIIDSLNYLLEIDIINKIQTIDICNQCGSTLNTFKPLYVECDKIRIEKLANDQMQDRLRKRTEIRNAYQERTNNIYILKIENEARYKIGISTNVDSRVSTINTSSPYNVEFVYSQESERARKLEKELHNKYDAKRLDGEWFQLTKSEVEEIIYLINKNS